MLLLSATALLACVVLADACGCDRIQRCFSDKRKNDEKFAAKNAALKTCRMKCNTEHFAAVDKFSRCFSGDDGALAMKSCLWHESGLCNDDRITRVKRDTRVKSLDELRKLVRSDKLRNAHMLLQNITNTAKCMTDCFAEQFIHKGSTMARRLTDPASRALQGMVGDLNIQCHAEMRCKMSIPERILDFKAFDYCQSKHDLDHSVCTCILGSVSIEKTAARAFCNRLNNQSKMTKGGRRQIEELITEIDSRYLLPFILE